ncbi:hypothetical protein JCGZ_20561 [Jatropha curcas]|uniref:CCT domain-containing protein n=1 Tax=Jatropha curcas TaxID=180498 RepID=A0A067JZG8_JATCU|nr:hypothetical protein JCGZ_20561 [Jatropha curcas]
MLFNDTSFFPIFEDHVDRIHSLDQFSENPFTPSLPPNDHQLENLTTPSQTTQLQPLQNGSDFAACSSLPNECNNFFDDLETFFYNSMESPHKQQDSTINDGCLGGQIMISKIHSTGDLQNNIAAHRKRCSTEETNLQVIPYSAEERKKRIEKYRAKRPRRNFNKTIKYVSRKRVADNRARIRGRFASDEETVMVLKQETGSSEQGNSTAPYGLLELTPNLRLNWFDGLHEKNFDGTVIGGNCSENLNFINYEGFDFWRSFFSGESDEL